MENSILDVTFFAVGSCRGPERLARNGGSWWPVRFPALAVLLRHATRGNILFDTGYAPRYFDILRRWPYRLLGAALGARLSHNEELATQMRIQCNLRPLDVQTVIVSHFHLDHIAGLRDFPAADFVCTREAMVAIQELSGGWRAMKQAFHPQLLPTDFAQHVRLLEDSEVHPQMGFAKTWDIFGDGSLKAVALPGHAAGQIGLRFNCRDEEFFLIADTCWHEDGLHEKNRLHPLAKRLAWDDPSSGERTLALLAEFRREYPAVQVIPSHCPRAVARLAVGASSSGTVGN